MIISLLRLMRLYYSLPFAAGFVVIVAYLKGGDLKPIYKQTAFAFGALFCIISAGYVLNDICDIAVDKINCPRRALAAGTLARKAALRWAILLFLAGLVLAIFCGFRFLTMLTAITAGLVVYDLFSKRMGIFKDVWVAILMTSLYPLAFMLAEPAPGPRLNVLYIHPIWLFLTAMGYEMLKDLRDVKGDDHIAESINTFIRDQRFSWIARGLIIAGAWVTLLPYILGYCGVLYLAVSVAAVVLTIATIWRPQNALGLVYIEVFLITTGSLVDLLVYGP